MGNVIALLVFSIFASSVAANDTKSVMTSGRFNEFKIEKIQGGPVIFIIGIEKGSLAWLKANSEFFHSKGAIGFVVNATDPVQIETLRDESDYLKLFALEQVGDFIAEFGLAVYPAFIDTRAGVVAQ